METVQLAKAYSHLRKSHSNADFALCCKGNSANSKGSWGRLSEGLGRQKEQHRKTVMLKTTDVFYILDLCFKTKKTES